MLRLTAVTISLLLSLWGSAIFAEDFIDNDNGTITDNDTNLMWIQETPVDRMTWKEAWYTVKT